MRKYQENLAVSILIWLIPCAVAAWAGALASLEAGNFYTQLIRPAWAPPAWIFAPVWTLLYILMGIAAGMIWQNRCGKESQARIALLFFLLQLVFNAVWTWIFFVSRSGLLAFAEILMLWLLVTATVCLFWKVRAVAGILLLPYLAWVSFAAALTWHIWRNNLQIL